MNETSVRPVWRGPQLEQVSALDRGQPATTGSGAIEWADPRKLPEPEVVFVDMNDALYKLYYECG